MRVVEVGWGQIASGDAEQAKLRRLLRRGGARITTVTVARRAEGTRWAAFKVEGALTVVPLRMGTTGDMWSPRSRWARWAPSRTPKWPRRAPHPAELHASSRPAATRPLRADGLALQFRRVHAGVSRETFS